MGLLKETADYYRRRKREQREREQLINSKTDFSMLERLIKRVNDNPALKVRIVTRDGTRIEIHTYDKNVRRDFDEIDGNDWTEIS